MLSWKRDDFSFEATGEPQLLIKLLPSSARRGLCSLDFGEDSAPSSGGSGKTALWYGVMKAI